MMKKFFLPLLLILSALLLFGCNSEEPQTPQDPDTSDSASESDTEKPKTVNYFTKQRRENLAKLGVFFEEFADEDYFKTPTREQTVYLTVKLLGVKEEVLAESADCPFTDVSDAYKSYVSYANEQGLILNKESDTLLGADTPVYSHEFLSYVLAALGYFEANGDFAAGESYLLASELDLCTKIKYKDPTKTDFTMTDVLSILYNSMTVRVKDTKTKIVSRLIQNGQADLELAKELEMYIGNEKYEINGEFVAEDLGFVTMDWLTDEDTTYDWEYSIIEEDGLYKIWWTRGNPYDVIFYAESTDLKTWTNGQEVIRIEENTEWIKFMLGNPSVLHVDGVYYMYFEAPATIMEGGGECDNNVFLATSPDGLDWTMYPNNENPEPIIRMDPDDMAQGKYGVGQPHALYIDGEFWVYYCDVVEANTVKLAKSKDGVDFGDPKSHPTVFNRNGFGVVYYEDLDMFVGTYEIDSSSPRDCNIYLNFSYDGINWITSSCADPNEYIVNKAAPEAKVRSFPDIAHDAHGHVSGDTLYVGYLQGSRMHTETEDWRVTCATWDPFFTAIKLGVTAE